MSQIIISNGDQVTKDPSDAKVCAVDWDKDNLATLATIATSTWTITGIYPVQEWSATTAYSVGDQVISLGQLYTSILAHTNFVPPNVLYWTVTGTAFTKDSESRLTAALATTVLGRTVTLDNRVTQLRLIGGLLGQTYEVANKVVTNETPSQTKERSFRVLIEQM